LVFLVYYFHPIKQSNDSMKSNSLSLRHQQPVNRHPSEYQTSDNIVLPILALSQLPTWVELPMFGSKIPAGFPSPADDHLEATIDLNRQYVRNPASTFFVRVKGHSMIGAGIHDSDMLLVDRSVDAQSGAIVLAIVNGEFTLKRLVIENDDVWLMPENPEFQPVKITEGMDFQIWGVATDVFHSLKQK